VEVKKFSLILEAPPTIQRRCGMSRFISKFRLIMYRFLLGFTNDISLVRNDSVG